MPILKEILIIDDDATSQLINRVVIHKMNITERITVKSDGFQALAFLREKYSLNDKLAAEAAPDLILLDIHMPVINGFNFLEALKDMNWGAVIRSKIIILTSSLNGQDFHKAATYGVRGYIVKPLTKEKLLSILNQSAIS